MRGARAKPLKLPEATQHYRTGLRGGEDWCTGLRGGESLWGLAGAGRRACGFGTSGPVCRECVCVPPVFSLYLLVLAVGVCLGGVLLGFGEGLL